MAKAQDIRYNIDETPASVTTEGVWKAWEEAGSPEGLTKAQGYRGEGVLPKITKHVSLEIKDFCLVHKLIRNKINHHL